EGGSGGGGRCGDGRGYDGLPAPDGKGQKPARRVAAFTPPLVRIPSPRRGAGTVAPRRRYARDPSAALYGLDGLRLSAARAKIRNHRRLVRRALSAPSLPGLPPPT